MITPFPDRWSLTQILRARERAREREREKFDSSDVGSRESDFNDSASLKENSRFSRIGRRRVNIFSSLNVAEKGARLSRGCVAKQTPSEYIDRKKSQTGGEKEKRYE